jgi:hypothetical protein
VSSTQCSPAARKLTRVLTLSLAAGAIAAPAASAMLPRPDSGPSTDSTPAPVVVKPVQPGGFDYGDAGIGAGIAVALVAAGAGGTLAMRSRRSEPSPFTN